jgi:hypothetical protein
MSLVGPYMTTTQYNRKQKPTKNKKVLVAQAKHAAWLKKMGVDDASLEKRAVKNKNGRRVSIYEIKVAAHGPAKESMTYSGERQLLGIATMHKSNMVPIFADNKQAAIDVAQMRRN